MDGALSESGPLLPGGVELPKRRGNSKGVSVTHWGHRGNERVANWWPNLVQLKGSA
jgi:hypothetical protein